MAAASERSKRPPVDVPAPHSSKRTRQVVTLPVGLDFGTKHSSVAVWDSETSRSVLVPNECGDSLIPSYVTFRTDSLIVGVLDQFRFCESTFFQVKRFLGRRFSDPFVQALVPFLPFKLIRGEGDRIMLVADYQGSTRQFYLEEIIAAVFTTLVQQTQQSSKSLNASCVYRVVVPAMFGIVQLQSIRAAAFMAGISVSTVGSPQAAALAYLEKHASSFRGWKKHVLVFDLGAGSTSAAVMLIDDGVVEVKSLAGNLEVGGADFDTRLMRHVIADFSKRLPGSNMFASPRGLYNLRLACEQTKCMLSAAVETNITIDWLHDGDPIYLKINRSTFEDLCKGLFQAALKPVEEALSIAELHRADIDEILVTGGSTRIPKIRSMLREFFDKEPRNISNPDEDVVRGAVIRATSVVTAGWADDICLLDTAPISLGIETEGKMMTAIILRSITYPVSISHCFSTVHDNQTTITFRVFEGESQFTKDNRLLGSIELTGIPPAPRGTPQIKVTFFSIDSTLNVQVELQGTNLSRSAHFGLHSRSIPIPDFHRLVKEFRSGSANPSLGVPYVASGSSSSVPRQSESQPNHRSYCVKWIASSSPPPDLHTKKDLGSSSSAPTWRLESWLHSLQCSHLISVFQTNNLDSPAIIKLLTNESLKNDLGITSLGIRLKILAAAKQLS